MKLMTQALVGIAMTAVLTACAGEGEGSDNATTPYQGSPSYLNPGAAVVKGRAVISFTGSAGGRLEVYSTPEGRMAATLSAMQDSGSGDLDMGTLNITDLFDPSLNVCVDGTSRCHSAFIRIYTVSGGAPFMVRSNRNPIPRRVGVDRSGALILESAAIDNSRGSLELADMEDTEYSIILDRNFRPLEGQTVTLYVEYVLTH